MTKLKEAKEGHPLSRGKFTEMLLIKKESDALKTFHGHLTERQLLEDFKGYDLTVTYYTDGELDKKNVLHVINGKVVRMD